MSITMKNLILITCLLALSCAVKGQVNYYAGHQTIAGDSVTYICEDEGKYGYILDNIENKRSFLVVPETKSGKEVPPGFSMGAHEKKWHRDAVARTVKAVFTPDQIAALAASNEEIGAFCVVELDGTIAEVRFKFKPHPLLYSIPPDQFYALEVQIKKNVTFIVDRNSQYLKWIFWAFPITFKNIQ